MFHWNDGPTLPLKSAGVNNCEAFWAGVAQRARDRDVGIQVGLGDADLLGLGRGGAFGAADVGPPLQQLRRNAHHHFAGRRGDRPLSQAGLQVGGRNAQQGAKLVLALPQRDFERRDLASICESVVCCWATSRSVTVPASKRAWMIFSTSRCSFAFCLASSICSWVCRMVT